MSFFLYVYTVVGLLIGLLHEWLGAHVLLSSPFNCRLILIAPFFEPGVHKLRSEPLYYMSSTKSKSKQSIPFSVPSLILSALLPSQV